ncbi:MAG: helix-turn-helix transcriptional regulator [Clostridia bacterium]|nr:helix-turn-helix transcriptional regulator [Clostridia bacterium]
MEITLKDTLKKLRIEKGITQEALAKHLYISAQSVGKWERGEGYPDITLLPKIALFFDTTVDNLLGLQEARIQEKVEKYQKESSEFLMVGKCQEAYEIWEKAYSEFPNNETVKVQYMYMLEERYFAAFDETQKQEKFPLLISIAESLLSSTDINSRTSAIQTLCYTYFRKKDIEKAKEYANMSGTMVANREQLLGIILKGEEGEKQRQQNTFAYLDLFIESLMNRATRQTNTSIEEKIKIFEDCIEIIKKIFYKGDYGFFCVKMSLLHSWIAKEYAKLENKDKTLENLEKMAEYSIMFDTLQDSLHTSIFVDKLDFKREYVSTSNPRNNSLTAMDAINQECFNFIKKTPQCQEILQKLEKYAKYKSND